MMSRMIWQRRQAFSACRCVLFAEQLHAAQARMTLGDEQAEAAALTVEHARAHGDAVVDVYDEDAAVNEHIHVEGIAGEGGKRTLHLHLVGELLPAALGHAHGGLILQAAAERIDDGIIALGETLVHMQRDAQLRGIGQDLHIHGQAAGSGISLSSRLA